MALIRLPQRRITAQRLVYLFVFLTVFFGSVKCDDDDSEDSSTEDEIGEDDDSNLMGIVDKIFVWRMQLPPKLQGVTEEINTMIDHYALETKKDELPPRELQQIYSRITHPYSSLRLPPMFNELRAEADTYFFEKDCRVSVRRARRRGVPFNPSLLLFERYRAEPVPEVETLSPDEQKKRQNVVNSWLRQQHLLRSFYKQKAATGDKQTANDYFKPFKVFDNDFVVTEEEVLALGSEVTFEGMPTDSMLEEMTKNYALSNADDE